MACRRGQCRDYTRLRNEVKTGVRSQTMRRNRRIRGLGLSFFAASCLMSCGPLALAQEQAGTRPDAPVAVDSSISGKQIGALPEKPHRFWDRGNDWLFAGVGASRTLDYFSTLNMRRRGRQEIFLTNDAVDNHTAFAAIEASATATSIGGAYLFHHYGHHKLERWTSFVHIGLATTGAVRNYCLKTAHAAVTPGSP